jgi:hypothetical protein
MVRYILRLEYLGNDQAQVVKPTGAIDIPSEADLESFDPDDVDAGLYVVFGPKVLELRQHASEHDARQWLRELDGKEGKGVGGTEQYRVFRIE